MPRLLVCLLGLPILESARPSESANVYLKVASTGALTVQSSMQLHQHVPGRGPGSRDASAALGNLSAARGERGASAAELGSALGGPPPCPAEFEHGHGKYGGCKMVNRASKEECAKYYARASWGIAYPCDYEEGASEMI